MAPTFNADEVFQMGVEIEKNGKAFYDAAAKTADNPEARALFQELSSWENGHIAVFEKLQSALSSKASEETTWDPDNEACLYIKAAAGSHVFGRNADPAKMATACTSTRDALEKAIVFEKDSIVVYTSMRNLVPQTLGKDDIDKLINEELQHIQMLTEKIAALG